MKPLYFAIAYILIIIGILGCQTNELKQYGKVKIGMDKDDVLGIMGSPQRSERWKGLDRWTYNFYQENQAYNKEIHFSEGKATYVGDLWKPEITAEEQDRLNEASNKEVELQAAQRSSEHKQQSSQFFNNEEARTQIRYVPQFEPVR